MLGRGARSVLIREGEIFFSLDRTHSVSVHPLTLAPSLHLPPPFLIFGHVQQMRSSEREGFFFLPPFHASGDAINHRAKRGGEEEGHPLV